MKLKIMIVNKDEIDELRNMIIKAYSMSFKDFYLQSYIDYTISRQTKERLLAKAENGHFYVAKVDNKIVGCPCVGDFYGKKDESCLFSFAVDPNFQGQGIGRSLMHAIEKDEYYIRAKRIECSSSIPAILFYSKIGFQHKNGKLTFEDESFIMEKFI